MPKYSRAAKFGLRLAISALCLVALAYEIDVRKTIGLLRNLEPTWVVCAIFLTVAVKVLLTRRWQIILACVGVYRPFMHLVRINFVAAYFGAGLPMAGTDVVRAALVTRSKISPQIATGSALVDRVVGFYALAVVAFLGSFLAIIAGSRIALFVVVLFCSISVLILGAAIPATLKFVATVKYLNRFPRIKHYLERSYVAWTAFARPRVMGECLLVSIGGHLLSIMIVIIAGAALGLHQSLLSYFIVVPVVWVAVMLPLSISGLGVREMTFAYVLGTMGFPLEQGATLGALISIIGLIGSLLGGVFLLLPTALGARRD